MRAATTFASSKAPALFKTFWRAKRARFFLKERALRFEAQLKLGWCFDRKPVFEGKTLPKSSAECAH